MGWPEDNSGVIYADNMTALRAIAKADLTNGDQVFLAFHTAIQYGGGGTFYWNSTSSAADDNGVTIISNDGGTGRWIRDITDRTALCVNDFGAKNSNSSADSAINVIAFQAAGAFMESEASLKGSLGYIPPIQLQAGQYYLNPLEISFLRAHFVGKGSGITRIRFADNFDKPGIYITGAQRLNAFPYGGFKGMSLLAGNRTYPALIYSEGAIDNQFHFNDLGYAGGTLTKPVDGLSIPNYLNMSTDKVRNDGVSGYGFRIRYSSEVTTPATTSGATTASWLSYQFSTAYDSVTGEITLSGDYSELNDGTAALFFTTGVLPTRTSTGLALSLGTAGVAYFVRWVASNKITIHDTEADARDGINPILLTAATGSGTHRLSMWQAVFPVTAIDTVTETITFTNDKNILIATSVNNGDTAWSIGTGNTTTITALAGLHGLIPVSTGTLDTALTAGTVYYPIYVDAYNIRLASTPANAAAGTPIALNGDGTGTMYLLYNHGLSILAVSGFKCSNYTYDNSGAATINTINGVACSGLGVIFADFRTAGNKGAISFDGHRVEINKQPSPDFLVARDAPATMFRIEVGRAQVSYGCATINLTLDNIPIDTGTAFKGSDIRVIGNKGLSDLAPSANGFTNFNVGALYNNDRGTATSKTPPYKTATRSTIGSYSGYSNFSSSGIAGRLDVGYNAVQGLQNTPYVNAQFTSSMFKRNDLVQSLDAGVAYYQAVQSTLGFSKGTGTTSIGATITATAGDIDFVCSAIPTDNNFGDGCSITITGAGSGGTNLTGIVSGFVTLGASGWHFNLRDSAGTIIPCGTTVAAAVCNFAAVILAKVPTLYSNSAALNFASIAALASEDLTISATTGVTLTAGRVVRLGLPSNVPAGIVYTAFVTTGGASVTVRATNITAGTIDPPSGTFSYEVSV